MARVAFPSPSDAWVEGTVLDEHGPLLRVQASDGNVSTCKKSDVLQLYEERENYGAADDITHIGDLNDATLLWTLRERYANDQIYTNIGSIIVSVNPCQPLSLYGQDKIAEYQKKPPETLPPHPFALAHKAWKGLQAAGVSQSVVLSGESGSGKTEATKVVLKFLTFLSAKTNRSNLDIAARIFASNPILEAFGNARTSKNNNASRFGKFIKIEFQDKRQVGASIDHYLLEKTRVVGQGLHERSFHIFYQLIKGASREERQKYQLFPSPQSYSYLTNGDLVISGMNDAEDFKTLKQAMQTLGINEEERDNIFRTLSAILCLGNIQFNLLEGSENHVKLDPSDPVIDMIASLLMVQKDDLMKRLTLRLFQRGGAAGSVWETPLTEATAKDNRDGLAKALYQAVFNDAVNKVNRGLMPPDHPRDQNTKFIGIFDVHGFEKLERNTLEQLCINYADEKMFHQFNDHLFRAEQEGYIQEGVPWTQIPYSDNIHCVELLENSIFSCLDEEGLGPRGSDKGFHEKIFKKEAVTQNPNFFSPGPAAASSLTFGIKHFLDGVIYSADGLLEKNKDKISEDAIQLLSTSESEYIQHLLRTEKELAPAAGGGGRRQTMMVQTKPSTSSLFRTALGSIISQISSSERHYIRCIKPNDLFRPSQFNGARVMNQLRGYGVLQTVQLRKSGFSQRMPFDSFLRRFNILQGGQALVANPSRGALQQFLVSHVADPADVAVGNTKVFLNERAAMQLAKKVQAAVSIPVTVIQTQVRAMWARVAATKLRDRWFAAVKLQSHVRRFFSFRVYAIARERRAVIMLQSLIRRTHGEMRLIFLKKKKREEDDKKLQEKLAAEAALAAQQQIEELRRQTQQRPPPVQKQMSPGNPDDWGHGSMRSRQHRRVKLGAAVQQFKEEGGFPQDFDNMMSQELEEMMESGAGGPAMAAGKSPVEALQVRPGTNRRVMMGGNMPQAEAMGGGRKRPPIQLIGSQEPQVAVLPVRVKPGNDEFPANGSAPFLTGMRKRAPLQRDPLDDPSHSQPDEEFVARDEGEEEDDTHPRDQDGRMLFNDDDPIDFVLLELCKEEQITRMPKPEVFEIFRNEGVDSYGVLKTIDQEGLETLILRGVPSTYKVLLENAILLAEQRASEGFTPNAISNGTNQQQNQPQEQEEGWGFDSLFKRIFGEQLWPGEKPAKKVPRHPLGKLDPATLPYEDIETDFIYSMCHDQVVSGEYYIDPQNLELGVNLMALSVQISFPDLGDVSGQFLAEEHVPPAFLHDDFITFALDIYTKLEGMDVREAKIQYIRQLNPLPLFYWTVADSFDDDGNPFLWRLAFDDQSFHRYDMAEDGTWAMEPSASACHANITKTRLGSDDGSFHIHLKGEDLPAFISFFYEKAEAGIEISSMFSYFQAKYQYEETVRANDPGDEFAFVKVESVEIKVHIGRGNAHTFEDLNLRETVQESVDKIARRFGLVNDGRFGLRSPRSRVNDFFPPDGFLGDYLPESLKAGKPVDIFYGIRIFVPNSPSKNYSGGEENLKILKFDFQEMSMHVANGDWEVPHQVAAQLAALQFQSVFPNQPDFVNPQMITPDSLVYYIAEPWRADPAIIHHICTEYNRLTSMKAEQAMLKYIEVVNTLPTFGHDRFHVRSRHGPEILTISSEGLKQIDPSTGKVIYHWNYPALLGWKTKDQLLSVKATGGSVLKWAAPEVPIIAEILSYHVTFKLRQSKKKDAKEAVTVADKVGDEECVVS